MELFAQSSYELWWFKEARRIFLQMLDHKLDPIIIGEQVVVLAADGKFYHHAILTKYDSEKKKYYGGLYWIWKHGTLTS